jgi:hypothetical protein
MYIACRFAIAVSSFCLITCSNWFKSSKFLHDAQSSKLNKVLSCRGGASKDGDGKIKGACIGIDLGTTYRCD